MSALDQQIAEQIARAQDMLGRLGQRDAYEVNYTSEKLGAAMQACADALGLCGYVPDDVAELAGKSAALGWIRRTRLREGQ